MASARFAAGAPVWRLCAALAALGLLAAGHGAEARAHARNHLDTTSKASMASLQSPELPGPAADALGGLPGPAQGAAGGLSLFGSAAIRYHGGPIMLGRTNAYVIWYGSWPDQTTTSSTPAIVRDYLANVGGSPYFNINTTYTNRAGQRVSNQVAYGGSTTDAYSKGTTLSDQTLEQVVATAVTNGTVGLPGASPSLPRLPDPGGVYFVLTSRDVSESSGFLSQYCGFHTNATVAGVDIKYSFVGDASKNLKACAGQTAASPNANPAGDAMVNVVAHELEEAVTDPDLDAWYDNAGAENADKCAWKFGTTATLPGGAKYNMTIGARKYLIQQNWVNSGKGSCTLSY